MSGSIHELTFSVKLFFIEIGEQVVVAFSYSALLHCFSLIKMQEVAAVLLTCTLHSFLLCSLLNMSWHVLGCVSICS